MLQYGNTPMLGFEFSLEVIILSLGYLGILAMMIANGFSSFPSSQVLYILTGYFISVGTFAWAPVIIFGAIGNTIGNVLLYEAVRRKGVAYALKKNFIPEEHVEKFEKVFSNKGAWFLFLGKLVPALKVFVPIAGGMAKTPRALFAFLMLISSAVWAWGFNMIGYTFGKSSDVFGKFAIVLAIFAIILAMWIYRKMNAPEVS